MRAVAMNIGGGSLWKRANVCSCAERVGDVRRAALRVPVDELAHVVVVGVVPGEHVGDVRGVGARPAVVDEAQHVVREQTGRVRTRRDRSRAARAGGG